MDTSKLTPEERNTLHSLVRSPGWALLMEKLFIPQVQLATQFLDRPQAEQSGKADWLRGVKASYMNLIEVVYYVAGIESPFTRHNIALLENIRQYSDVVVAQQNGKQKEEKATHEDYRRARSSFPV
jgi:hypothetical protein